MFRLMSLVAKSLKARDISIELVDRTYENVVNSVEQLELIARAELSGSSSTRAGDFLPVSLSN